MQYLTLTVSSKALNSKEQRTVLLYSTVKAAWHTSSKRQTGFRDTLSKFHNVFSPSLPGYDGKAGSSKAVLNMGPVLPTQRKGKLLQYSRKQQRLNLLEEQCVFKPPEDLGITVEYLNPLFLRKKPNGAFRLRTAFADVGRYTKLQPSLMPHVDSILRHIAQ